MLPPRRVKRLRGGRFRITIPTEERQLLRSLPRQVEEMLGTDDPALARLFPPAYGGDHAAMEAEYQRFMRDDLEASHRRSLGVLAETADADELDEEQMNEWMSALNQIRLVVGTRLDISEEMAAQAIDDDDPDAHLLALYHYLSWLQEQVVEALSRR